MEIRLTSLPIDQTINDSALIGKRVLSKDGEPIGEVCGIYLDPHNLSLEAIRVNSGLFSYDHYIGRNFISELTSQGVILTFSPSTEFVGKEVYDINGKKLGIVKEVRRIGPANEFVNFVISKNQDEQDLIVGETDIKEIGDIIELNIPSS
jgi:sporulation protein YlmC with PRC-barrel domain